jgi:hypothetical protein
MLIETAWGIKLRHYRYESTIVIQQRWFVASVPMAVETEQIQRKNVPLVKEIEGALVAPCLTVPTVSNDLAGNVQRPATRLPQVPLETPVLLFFQDQAEDHAFIRGTTITVGPSGAHLSVSGEVAVGQSVLLFNSKTHAEIACQIRDVNTDANGERRVDLEFPVDSPSFWGIVERPIESKRSLKWYFISAACFLGLAAVWFSTLDRTRAEVKTSWIPGSQSVATDDVSLIPGSDTARLAVASDFDSDAVSWLRGSGQLVSGRIPGNYSGASESAAYILIGKQNQRRAVILATGESRYDAEYPAIALAARIPKELIQKIQWADASPPDASGDGLLIVRNAGDPASAIVIFLWGAGIASGHPADYRQIPFSELH